MSQLSRTKQIENINALLYNSEYSVIKSSWSVFSRSITLVTDEYILYVSSCYDRPIFIVVHRIPLNLIAANRITRLI